MKRIFRRDFLKYSAAGASVIAMNHYMGDVFASTAQNENAYVNRNTGKRVQGFNTMCSGCGAGCGVTAYVHDGFLVSLKGNPAHPVNKGKLCAVGEAGFYAYHDPERLIKPMVRAGSRGEGRFREISWADALDIISKKMKEAGRDVVIETGTASAVLPAYDLAAKLGGKVANGVSFVSAARERALMESVGAPYDIPDVANAELVINFGSNPLVASHAGVRLSGELGRRLAEGGLRLVTLDPRLSETAGRSGKWLPLIPGTDGFVALAMANVIMSEGLYDADFIARRTNTSVAKLRSHLGEYTPDAAERISTVPAAEIRKLAIDYAKASRAAIITGGGISGNMHGLDSERAIWMLAAITGKLGRTGCNLIPEGAAPSRTDMALSELHAGIVEGKSAPSMFIAVGANPCYNAPENELLARTLMDDKKVGYIVAVDTHITDTGRYADMVLPMTTYLEEHSSAVSHTLEGYKVISYAKPVARVKGECRPFAEIAAALIRKSGGSPKYNNASQAADENALDLLGKGNEKGLNELDKSGFVSYAGYAREHAADRTRFDTPGGVVMLEVKGLGGLPGLSAKDVYKAWKDGEMALVTFSPVGYRQGFTENNLLLKELNHTSRAMINADTGRRMGLRSRDIIELKSKAGSVKLPVVLSPGVHPNVVAVAEGCGHEGYGNIEHGERYRGPDPFTYAIWWGHAGEGVNPNRVKPLVSSDESGPGTLVTKVKIQKA